MHPKHPCRLALILAVLAAPAFGQALGSLKSVRVPEPPDLDRYVRDRAALVVLGKALFWDMQLGSDGRTACGSCHFHAGADHRARNQFSNPNGAFEANHTQSPGDFPFRMFADPGDNRSQVLRDSGQRAGSAGVFRRIFSGLADAAAEDGSDASDLPDFRIGGLNVRQVTPRNTPSVIDAVFNVRNTWDGRAGSVFNGANPFGESDAQANAVVAAAGQLSPEMIRIGNSSLASQAVGPPLNSTEMSYDGRTWPMLGRKMLALRPLALQKIASDDSVLAALPPSSTYLALVQSAFQPAYWDSAGLVNGFTAAELNFSLFFGLAVQAYESTLISGQTRFDQFSEGNSGALTARELAGLRVFQRSECTDCHLGPEFTSASFTNLARQGAVQRVRTGIVTDTGFIHTGVRPSLDDSGLDGIDDFGVPYSLAARQGSTSLGIAGAFKTPGLRNVEFTGPYFHNGGQATLEQVVEFYNRGGDFPNSPNLSPDVHRLNLNADERATLVEFLRALSDDRVRFERAPFDHPEICVPVGYADSQAADARFPGSAVDRWVSIPAVGRAGNAVPLQTFAELLQGVGIDGSRAHTLTDACSIP
jgi:cytochrome c peroxidase